MEEVNKRRWFALCHRLGACGDVPGIYNELVIHYTEPHRVYHTIKHVNEGINELDLVRRFVMNPDAVEMAYFFHDEVQDTKAGDNEERSAELALSAIKRMYLPDGFGKIVVGLILATKHNKIPSDIDEQFISDIDLSIFGQSEKRFDEYEKQIRKEYEWVPEKIFSEERLKILTKFIKPSSIYFTRFFFDKYETQANRNLVRSIKKLTNCSQ